MFESSREGLEERDCVLESVQYLSVMGFRDILKEPMMESPHSDEAPPVSFIAWLI
jgi:hypothetical protein